jgi:hypothetical protein
LENGIFLVLANEFLYVITLVGFVQVCFFPIFFNQDLLDHAYIGKETSTLSMPLTLEQATAYIYPYR